MHKTQFPAIRYGTLPNSITNTILIIESKYLSSDLDIKFLKAFQLDPFKMQILYPINYLDMSGIQVTTKIHFIAALLAHAIADTDFNSHKCVWITSDKLASALNTYYCIHSLLYFNGNKLYTATCNKYLRILNELRLGTINSENFELNKCHAYECSHCPNKGRRSILFFIETFESTCISDVVGMKRSCAESIGKSQIRRKSTEKVRNAEEEKAISLLVVASERSIPIFLRRLK